MQKDIDALPDAFMRAPTLAIVEADIVLDLGTVDPIARYRLRWRLGP